MVMKKLLYIAPHLSTGGLPQYLYKKIELLQGEFDIYLVEWDDHTGGRLVVQRNKITNLLPPDHFFTLDEDKKELLYIIDQIKPDIIHLEEIPEFFMDYNIAEKIYNTDRSYSIIETSHDSSYDTAQKKFFPDKFMFVSDWQIQQYKDINIPKVLVEYPIEYKERPNREEALKTLGLDPNKKHILHVGLFTPRKNQAEFFEYARILPEYQFHCVGNQADNFKHYWEPLMQNKPDNLTWWNERSDVDSFYSAMDLFLFTSKGNNNDKETMPLVIREAISWQLPILIYNLPVYLNYFDKFNNTQYLEFNNIKENCNKIKSVFSPKLNDIDSTKEAYIVGTYPNTSFVEKITIECLKALKKDNRIIITTSHYPVSKEIQELSDYVIYDKNNITTKHTFVWMWYAIEDNWEIYSPIDNGQDNYHGPACHNNIHNAMALANNLGLEKAYLINYDYHLKDIEGINYISKILNNHNLYSNIRYGKENQPQIDTSLMGIKPKIFLEYLPQIFNKQEWDNIQIYSNSANNGLEHMWYNLLKNVPNIYWESEDEYNRLHEKTLNHLSFSQAEYFNLIPVQNTNNQYIVTFQVNNDIDSRIFIVKALNKNNEIIFEEKHNIDSRFTWWRLFNYSLETENYVLFRLEVLDTKTQNHLYTKEILLDDNYITNQLPKNGYFKFK